jgi:hypothetical protein
MGGVGQTILRFCGGCVHAAAFNLLRAARSKAEPEAGSIQASQEKVATAGDSSHYYLRTQPTDDDAHRNK